MDGTTWEETLRLPEGLSGGLERFIRDPSTREADVFFEQTFDVGDGRSFTVTVKHDLYEGVVMNLTLLDEEAYQFLAGHEAHLGGAGDLPGEYEVRYGQARYRLRLEFS
ncbi:MAG: hypothetical protein M1516_00685 [Firmicutes bacterium]|jgi:hypothetical protein|nr:hypothetical protein [Bacillota bacterium]